MKNNSDFYGSLDELMQHLVRDQHYRLRFLDFCLPVTIISPHGGFIEEGTSYLAEAVAGVDHNLFDFQGLRRSRPWELHVTSTKFRHPILTEMLGRSKMALSLHSMGTQNDGKILIGGLNTDLKAHVVDALRKAGFPVITSASRYRGVHPQNIVNLAQNKGVQIELTSSVIRRMFKKGTPRFVPEQSHLVLSKYGRQFVACLRQALMAGR